MWLLLTVSLMVPASSPTSQPDVCRSIHQTYRDSLAEVPTLSEGSRQLKFQYLRSVEANLPQCFAGKTGQDLIGQRKHAESLKYYSPEETVDPGRKRRPGEETRTYPMPQDSATTWQPVGWTPHPASAALFSLVIPGFGQALQGRPGAAWFFFLGVTALNGTGVGLLVGQAANPNWNQEARGTCAVAGVVLLVVGGVLHLINIIHAATHRP